MHTALSDDVTAAVRKRLERAGSDFAARYPGESGRRQPVHTVYGGAHLFKADSARKLGDLALRALSEHAPTEGLFGDALGLPESVPLRETIYARVRAKLLHEPVEDFRIDFEDGYGTRPDDEEDACAIAAAEQVALAHADGTLPPLIGIRTKPFNREWHQRAMRTLDLFLSTLVAKLGGELPLRLVVTIPKVTSPEQVAGAAEILSIIEDRNGLEPSTVPIELMIETTQSIIDHAGRCPIPALVEAGEGRVVAAHFGVYDYTASCSITAQHQSMRHPACDFARHVLQVALAGTGVALSDGATNVLPVGDRAGVHRAWRLHYEDVRHSLRHAYWQGWDLHPAQLPSRYAAAYAFFLEGLESASQRLRAFVDQAARATLVGGVFDDAATGQGLLNFFLRGINCGAITEEEATRTGLSLEELRSRSFSAIVNRRQVAERRKR